MLIKQNQKTNFLRIYHYYIKNKRKKQSIAGGKAVDSVIIFCGKLCRRKVEMCNKIVYKQK